MSNDAMLRAYWMDRRWFELNSESDVYERPYVPGEFAEYIDPDDEDDSATPTALANAKFVRVWMSDAPAAGHQRVRHRSIVGFELPVFSDPWDEVNWMLKAGDPGAP